jgi:hypothetical protein
VAGGRPSLYEPDRHPAVVAGFTRQGLNGVQVAQKLGISFQTLNEWRKKFPELAEALKTSREEADSAIENALYKRAMGYDYEETEVTVSADGKSRRVKRVKKHMPPSVAAQVVWLANRNPKNWRRRDAEAGNEPEDNTDNIKQLLDTLRGIAGKGEAGGEASG